MELYKHAKKCNSFKELYKVPFKLNTNNIISSDIRIVLILNSIYGFGDIIFCLKIHKYIKEWYNIDATILSSMPKALIQNGITNIYGMKVPGKPYTEGASIKHMKIYNVDSEGKFLNRTTPEKFDIIMVTPWIGTDYTPNHTTIKRFFPYSNRFNTFLFSSYNPPQPHLYDFTTGIGKNHLGLLLSEKTVQKRPEYLDQPFIMVHISYYHSVNINGCFDKFVKLMCKKYYQKYEKLDIVIPKLVLENEIAMKKLIKYIKTNGYYDSVQIILSDKKMLKDPQNFDRVLRFRADILPIPYQEYINLFNYCLPDVLTTGNQSPTDIISCCKNYNIYYQIMPWERKFANGLSKVLKAPYLSKVKTSCGFEKMKIDAKLNLRLIEENNDFRILGKAKLDSILKNIKLINTDYYMKKFVKIVNSIKNKSKTTVLKKFKKLL
jgi:hypothetical protein